MDQNGKLREQLNESVQRLSERNANAVDQLWSRAEHEIVLSNFETAIEEVETLYSQVLTQRHRQFGALHKIRMLIGRAAQECYTKTQKETQTEEWIGSTKPVKHRSQLEARMGSGLYQDLQLHLPPLLKPALFDFKSLQYIRDFMYTALPKRVDFYSFLKETVLKSGRNTKVKALAQTISLNLSAKQLAKDSISPFPSLTLFLFQSSMPSSIVEHLMARHKDILLLFFFKAIEQDLQRVQDNVHHKQSSGLRSLSLLDCYSLISDLLDKYSLSATARVLELLQEFIVSGEESEELNRAQIHCPQSIIELHKVAAKRVLEGKVKREAFSFVKAKLLFQQPCFLKELQEALLDKKQSIVGEITLDFWKDFLRQNYSNILSEREILTLSKEFFPGIIEHIDFHSLAEDMGDFTKYRGQLQETQVSINCVLNALYLGLRGIFQKKSQEWFALFKKFNKLELGIHKLHSLQNFTEFCRQLIYPEPSPSQIKVLFLKTTDSSYMGVEKFNLHSWLELLITEHHLIGISPRSGYKQQTPIFARAQLTVQLIPPTDEDQSNYDDEPQTLLLVPKSKKKKQGLKNRSLSFRPSSKPTSGNTSSVLNLPKTTSAY